MKLKVSIPIWGKKEGFFGKTCQKDSNQCIISWTCILFKCIDALRKLAIRGVHSMAFISFSRINNFGPISKVLQRHHHIWKSVDDVILNKVGIICPEGQLALFCPLLNNTCCLSVQYNMSIFWALLGMMIKVSSMKKKYQTCLSAMCVFYLWPP